MKKLKAVLINLELILMCIIVIVPIVWIVLSAFNADQGLATSSLIPSKLTLHNFTKLLHTTKYGVWFKNTLMVAVVNSFVSVALVMLTSWVMSRFHFKGKKASLLSILILSMFPSFLSMTAIYTLFVTLGLIGKPLALVLIYAAGAIPYNVWLVKGYLDGIPKAIDEAAYIDGSTKLKTFFQIILPMSKPIITYVAVSQFMTPWMDYILPNLLLTGDDNKTLAVGIYSLITGRENTKFTLFAAGAVLVAIPITIIYLLFQKYLVEGISAGASKE
ncbi:maltose/maltodextrin ABC transporter, permease protein MalG [Lachnospiraceae bacterium KM106-2]|nr:maltose/maltodextrin ABC transporter, permease protein MalG [Lachnospiraceae bacterium KM106-2]